MSLNDSIGQQLPDDGTRDRVWTKIDKAVRAMDENRPAIQRWFWKGYLAFNLTLASLVFWLSVVPRLI